MIFALSLLKLVIVWLNKLVIFVMPLKWQMMKSVTRVHRWHAWKRASQMINHYPTISADDKIYYIFLTFARKQALIFPTETVCMGYQSYFLEYICNIEEMFQNVVCWKSHPACLTLIWYLWSRKKRFWREIVSRISRKYTDIHGNIDI